MTNIESTNINQKLVLSMNENEFKFTYDIHDNANSVTIVDNMIIDNRERSPPYNWSENIFQSWIPVSGNFPIDNNLEENNYCSNNPTGRAFYANPCGYWSENSKQFFPGKIYKTNNTNGLLYPTSEGIMTPPKDRVVYGYSRIGQEYKSR